jgi:hypothetical protein
MVLFEPRDDPHVSEAAGAAAAECDPDARAFLLSECESRTDGPRQGCAHEDRQPATSSANHRKS